MATITTDTFLDGGTARTAGEAWTCNGGRLTVRTDTRWHANAPASMAGTLGSLTISATLGGGYTIDGTKVRWLPFDAGSGNVPAIGTNVSGGTSGANGYLLGVWASLTSAPTAVGAAMPTTGFMKLREATGSFIDNDVMTGIGATTTGADVVGWIEVVHDQTAAILVPRLGSFTVRGDWFSLGTTTGAANQIVQIPTNGSTTTYVPGVWIATTATPTTDEDWEFYPSLYAAGMITANLGTDARSKFVLMGTDGTIRIGHNGTTDVGYVPAAGRQIRIPNVFGRHCTTAARATNVLPSTTASTRPDFETSSAGAIDVDHFLCDWYMSFLQPYSVRIHNSATFDYLYIAECASAFDIYDGGNGISQLIDARSFNITSCFAGGTVEKWYAPRYAAGTGDHAFEVLYSIGQTFTNVQAGIVTFARSSGFPFSITQCSGLTFNSCRQFNGPMTFTTCFDSIVNNIDHVDRYVGATTTSTAVYAVQVYASSDNITVDGVTFGLGGAIANCHPYSGVFNASLSKNLRFRNLGSRSAMISGGSANQAAYIYLSSGNNQNVKVQKCYMQPTRTGAIFTLNSDKGSIYEHVYGDFADTITVSDLNTHVKNCGGTNTVTGQASVYGTHFWDAFTSDTAGRVILSMNEPTAETDPFVTIVSGTPKFSSAGGLVMAAVNDEVILEQDYFVKGCTALTNTAPIVTGTNVTYVSGPDWGNHDIFYQIDTGSGYGGTWKDLTAANLSSETITPNAGFKIKYRIVCDTAAANNNILYIRIQTTSTLAAQTDNLYPLDTFDLTLTGLKNPTEVRVFDAGTTTEIGGQENVTSGTFTTSIDAGSYPLVDISILALGYQNTRLTNIDLSGGNVSIPVQQQLDRQYGNV